MKNAASIIFRVLFTLVTTAIAIVGLLGLWDYYVDAPWTRDGKVVADVVSVAPDVSGLVTDVLVKDNQVVRAGDVLFRIDPAHFTIALRQAEAVVAQRKAAAEQTRLDYQRYSKLDSDAVTQQKLELARAVAQEADAAYDQAVADSDAAKLSLERSQVRAAVNGKITNMNLLPGAYVTVGHGVMALIDEDTLRVEGYFEETKLPRIRDGERANIRLIGDRKSLSGHVESIAGGIVDRERTAGSDLLANVNPTFSWVRLAQRVPVRIALDDRNNMTALVSGRTATVSIGDAEDFGAELKTLSLSRK